MSNVVRGFVLSFACWLAVGWSVPQCCLLSHHEGDPAASPAATDHQHHHHMTDSGGGARLQSARESTSRDCCISADHDVSFAIRQATFTSPQTALIVPVEPGGVTAQPLNDFSPTSPPALAAGLSHRSAPLRI